MNLTQPTFGYSYECASGCISRMVSDKPMGRCKVPVVIVPQEVFDGLQGQIASLEYQLETLKKSTPDQP